MKADKLQPASQALTCIERTGDAQPRIKIRVWWTCSDYVRHEHRWRWQAYGCGAAQRCLIRAWAWIAKEKKVNLGPTD